MIHKSRNGFAVTGCRKKNGSDVHSYSPPNLLQDEEQEPVAEEDED